MLLRPRSLSVTISTSTATTLTVHYRHETGRAAAVRGAQRLRFFRELCRRFNREEAFTEGLDKWAG